MLCPICEGEGFTKLPYIDDRGNIRRTQLFCIVCDGIGTIKDVRVGRQARLGLTLRKLGRRKKKW